MRNPFINTRLIDVKEAALKLGVSIRSLKIRIANGKFPAPDYLGLRGQRKWMVSTVVKWGRNKR